MKRLKKLFIIASLLFASNSYSYYALYYYLGSYYSYYCTYYDYLWDDCGGSTVIIYNSSSTAKTSIAALAGAAAVLAATNPELTGAIVSDIKEGAISAAQGLKRLMGCGQRRPLRTELAHEE